ncbi:hypothetical protein DFJ74DRAFT_706155 [Hyaloraphidium curvatum]|nr:hypothetical protein DFJ74DRAFT_706155 [Hyaloraphidium curvatum]
MPDATRARSPIRCRAGPFPLPDAPDATVNGRISSERAQQLLATPRLNRSSRPFPTDKVFKYEVYSELLANREVFLVQRMNMGIRDWAAFRASCEKDSFRAQVVQTKIFRALLRDEAKAGRPELVELEPFLYGSIAAVAASPGPEQVGESLVRLLKILNADRKALLLGGKIDSGVYSTDEILRISKLPPIADMRAELLGVLEQPARKLLELLGTQQGQVVALLNQHTASTGYQLGKILEMQEERLKGQAS